MVSHPKSQNLKGGYSSTSEEVVMAVLPPEEGKGPEQERDVEGFDELVDRHEDERPAAISDDSPEASQHHPFVLQVLANLGHSAPAAR